MASAWALKQRAIAPGPGVFVRAGTTFGTNRKARRRGWQYARPIRLREHWDRAALWTARKRSRAARRAQRARAR